MPPFLPMQLIPIDQSGTLEFRAFALRAELKQEEAALKEFEQHIEVVVEDLSSDLTELITQQSVLEAELDDLEHAMKEKQAKESLDASLEQHKDEQVQHESEREETAGSTTGKSNRSLRKRCKKLRDKIANVCHPDKTENKTLRAMFEAAQTFYDMLDYDGLNHIWEQVKDSKSKIKSVSNRAKADLLLVISSLEDRIEAIKNQRMDLIMSAYGQIAMAYRQSRMLAVNMYANAIGQEINHLRHQIRTLKAELNPRQTSAHRVKKFYTNVFDGDDIFWED